MIMNSSCSLKKYKTKAQLNSVPPKTQSPDIYSGADVSYKRMSASLQCGCDAHYTSVPQKVWKNVQSIELSVREMSFCPYTFVKIKSL